MKRRFAGFLTLLVVSGFWMTAYAIHEVIPSETQVTEPGPDAAKLNEYIIRCSPYPTWKIWPGKGKLYKGTGPHGSFLGTFANPTACFSLKNRTGMAYGSIIVKESYSADKKFDALTLMYKIRGYNPGAGDWFWAKCAPDGKILVSRRGEACVTCHGTKMDNDYIMTAMVK